MQAIQSMQASVKASLLAGIFESAMDAIITVDQQQKIILFNRAAEVMFGWRRQDVMHQPLEKLIPGRFRLAHARQLEQYGDTSAASRRMGGLDLVVHGLRANGEEFPLNVSISQVATSGGTLFTAIVRDVTAQQASQQASQAQLTLLETSISHLNDMVVITEAESIDEPGPRIVFVNAAFERHTGYSCAEVLGRSPRFLQGPLTQRLELDRMGVALRAWQPVRAELINYTKDVQAFWVELDIVPIADATGVFTHWVSVQRNVTERKRAEQAMAVGAAENTRLLQQVSQLNVGLDRQVAERTEALARQEALFHALAEQAPQVIWTLDLKGEVTYLNHAWFDLMGGTLQDWTGRQWIDAIHPEDWPGLKANWRQAQAREAPFSGTRRLLSPGGGVHTMAYRAAPVRDERGAVIFWVGIEADMSEIKRIEDDLRQSNQGLEAFSYSVSHDLRAPLSTINGFSSLLAKQLAGDERAKVNLYLSRIQNGVAQMGRLIDDLLSLSQVARTPLHRKPVDLSAMARTILGEWQARQPGHQVSAQIENGLQPHGDAGLLKVVMENLLGNAWKFSAQQAHTRISVGQQPDIAGLPVYFVRDNGAGFDMAHAEKLFLPFERLHAAGEFAGSGIGLATVSRVIERHGGRLWAESAPGEGAVFYFTLPKSAGTD